MKPRIAAPLVLLLISAFASLPAQATNVGISFSALTGTTAQETGVFRADLSGLGLTQLASVRIFDASGNEGSPGIWSGFDLDAIKLSSTLCPTAACAVGATGISAFDFVNQTIFTAGSMDAVSPGDPLDGPCLAGTSGVGCDFDNSIATLGAFDGLFPSAPGSGFLSMGRGGDIIFNLTMLVALDSPVYMYVGEVGNNGETLRGLADISDLPRVVPVPAAVWLFGTALVGFIGYSRRRIPG